MGVFFWRAVSVCAVVLKSFGLASGRHQREPGRAEAEVVEDPLGHCGLGDEGDEPATAALGIGEHVDGEDLHDEPCRGRFIR